MAVLAGARTHVGAPTSSADPVLELETRRSPKLAGVAANGYREEPSHWPGKGCQGRTGRGSWRELGVLGGTAFIGWDCAPVLSRGVGRPSAANCDPAVAPLPFGAARGISTIFPQIEGPAQGGGGDVRSARDDSDTLTG